MSYQEERVCSFDNIDYGLELLWRFNKDLIIERRISSVNTLVVDDTLQTYHFFATILIKDSFRNYKYSPLNIQCSFLSPNNTTIQKPFVEFENMQYLLDQLEAWFGHKKIEELFGENGVVYHRRPEENLHKMKFVKIRQWPPKTEF